MSPHFVFISNSSSSEFSSNDNSSQVLFLPFTAGVIVPIGRGLGLEVEAGYSVGFNLSSSGSETANAVTIGVGICGIGRTTAVSIVNVFNLLTSAF